MMGTMMTKVGNTREPLIRSTSTDTPQRVKIKKKCKEKYVHGIQTYLAKIMYVHPHLLLLHACCHPRAALFVLNLG